MQTYAQEGIVGHPHRNSVLSPEERNFFTSHESDIRAVLSALTPIKCKGESLVRVGHKNDGGYVMIQRLLNGENAYSIGVGKKADWEVEMADRYGYTSHMYDHTVNGSPVKHPKLLFNKIGLGNGKDMQTLPEMIRNNGHESDTNMVLSCDIEGGEWEILENIEAENFSQIGLELHWLLKQCSTQRSLSRMANGLNKLLKTHVPFHIHGNNWAGYFMVDGVKVPDVLEVSYVRRDCVELDEDAVLTFPTKYDGVNNKTRPEIEIGEFKWK